MPEGLNKDEYLSEMYEAMDAVKKADEGAIYYSALQSRSMIYCGASTTFFTSTLDLTNPEHHTAIIRTATGSKY